MKLFKGRFSRPGLSETDAELEVNFYNLILRYGEVVETRNIEELAFSNSLSQFWLNFPNYGIFSTSDISIKDTLAEYFPKSHFHPSPNSQFISPPILLFFVGFVGLILAVLAFYFWWIPRIGNYAGKHLPAELEKRIGAEMVEKLRPTWKIDSAKTTQINRFFKHLKVSSEFDMKVLVVKGKEINAFAMPGGQIVVYNAMLDKIQNPEELAALLAHESSHVIFRHTARTMCSNLANYIFFTAIFGDFTGLAAILVENADQIKGLAYSRDLELEADMRGLELMYSDKINPNGMLNLMKILQKEANQHSSQNIEFLSTHPLPDSRVKYISDYIRERPFQFEKDSVLDSIFLSLKN
jgi:Zn-dependent protease with chaperone function